MVDAEFHDVLLFTSYCGGDTKGCTNARPCASCLGMSNVFRVPTSAISSATFVRELSGDWVWPKNVLLCDGYKPLKPKKTKFWRPRP